MTLLTSAEGAGAGRRAVPEVKPPCLRSACEPIRSETLTSKSNNGGWKRQRSEDCHEEESPGGG